MNWTSDFSGILTFQTNHRFLDSASQFQYSNNIPSKYNQESELSLQRKEDQNFISNFILDRQKGEKKNLTKNSIKISNAKNCLVQIINDKKRIEKEILRLDLNDEYFDFKCELLMSDLRNVSKKISKFNLEVKIPLSIALQKRLKKRRGIKNKREKLTAFKKLNQEKTEEKHKLIDKLLIERSEEIEVVKYEAGLKRQADTVLHEVRKKKYEAKKMLNLLVALAKLRDLRSKQEEKLGGYCSRQISKTFNKVMEKFQKLWRKQLEVYKLEEKGLKIMLEENTVSHRKVSKFETNILHWEKVLFGDLTSDKNEKLLSMPNTDMQALIQVRRDWDQFLTTESALMATSIPPGWVLPPETKDELWKAFTRHSQKT